MRETATPQPTARNENALQTKGEDMKITALYERLSSEKIDAFVLKIYKIVLTFLGSSCIIFWNNKLSKGLPFDNRVGSDT